MVQEERAALVERLPTAALPDPMESSGWRAVAALVAVAAREETVMMPRRSMTVRLVVTAERVALVDRAVQLARLARMRLPS